MIITHNIAAIARWPPPLVRNYHKKISYKHYRIMQINAYYPARQPEADAKHALGFRQEYHTKKWHRKSGLPKSILLSD